MQKEEKSNLFDNRFGGSIAIRGFEFQFLYSCYSILQELNEQDLSKKIGLERLEDLDIIHKNEYVQLKTSSKDIDASFFTKNNILKNFIELYKSDKTSNFKLVHNSNISNGYLKKLENKKIDKDTLEHWAEKINELDTNLNIDVRDFLSRISFEKTTEKELYSKSKKLILEKFNLTLGSEETFLFALLHHILIWSKNRKEVTHLDLLQVIQSVKDSTSKTPTLEAINKNYVSEITFKKQINNKNFDNYFDGKSARPEHIIKELPIRRDYWEEKILESLFTHDIVTIKASSGQGKSTLAWQSAKIFEDEFNFDIYELKYCDDNTKVEELYNFFKTRLEIGKLPLIVIDGLNQDVSKYNLLIERLYSFPIKIIITSREEDWNRFKPDISKYDLDILDITLLDDEAIDIFEKLKKKEKIFKDIQTWQPSWEKIKNKALLIEYIYLLTHGSMLQDRLEYQVKCLREDELKSAVIIEILRIVSLADVLNIKLETRKLTTSLQDNIGFTSDRETVYSLLEKEYFIKFDSKYIEGLHPVRSEHLLKILHNFILIEETAISLLKIIDDKFIYDYFISISYYLDDEKEDFFEESSKIISQKSFSIMVDAIDGLMHFEAYNYWLENKEVFEEVYEKGFVNLFIMDTLPFTKLETIKNLNNIHKSEALEYLIKKQNELSCFNPFNADIYKFVSQLSKNITNFIDNSFSYYKVNFLIKWFRQFNLKFEHSFEFDEIFLLDILQKEEIEESRALFNFLYVQNVKKYNDFIEKNKSNIFSILKKKTNSLIIKEIDDDIKIEYLIDNEKADKLNECSMERIDIIYDFFPEYKRYCTEVLYLPFPNEAIFKVVVQNSIKQIPNENLYHDFDVHINQIWIKAITQHYSENSIYEWQKYHYQLRTKLLDFTKKINRTFELFIQKKIPQNKSQEIVNLANEVLSIIKLKKEFPRVSINYEDEIKFISDYIGSFQNVLNQIFSLFSDKFSQNSNSAIYNLKDVKKYLTPMQNSFNIIQNSTSFYFDFEEIEIEEKYWTSRLLKTIDFYRYENNIKLSDIKNQIEEWFQIKATRELENIYKILDTFEKECNFEVIYPKSVIEDGNFREIVIGIKDMKEQDFEKVLLGLVGFYKIKEVSFLNVIAIVDQYATYAFRVPITCFQKVNHLLKTEEYEESEWGNFYPVNITAELLSYLKEEIVLNNNPQNENISILIQILFEIWELTEYRGKLDINSKIERDWLTELEREYSYKIKNKINDDMNDNQEFIYSILDNKIQISKENILKLLNENLRV